MPVLDTNVLLRYLTQDIPDQARRSGAILDSIVAGEHDAFVPEGVLVETVQVLQSKNLYAMPRDFIRGGLRELISLPHIQLPNKRTYLYALDLYVGNPRLSYGDFLCIAHADRMGDQTVISFD